MSAMSELSGEFSLPLEVYDREVQVQLVAAWLSRNETSRLDQIAAEYKVLAAGLGRRAAREVWREAFAVYIALQEGVSA